MHLLLRDFDVADRGETSTRRVTVNEVLAILISESSDGFP